MKTKKFFWALAAAACMIVCFASCSDDDDDSPSGSNYSIESVIPSGDIMAGTAVTFVDNSLNVSSRQWTFEDGSPSTSTAASVNVTFSSAGEKAVTLSVTFKDNSVQEKSYTVTVIDPISATINVSCTTAMGCIRIGEEVTFSLSDVTGSPDSYSWTFEGATVENSTDASPKVTWDKRVREATVTCVLTRSSDNAQVTLEQVYVVGNYPMFRALSDLDLDNYSFELGNYGGWILWTANSVNRGTWGENSAVSIVEDGANGTSHSLCVDVTALDYTVDGEFADLFPRDAWVCNAHLEAGKTYELSYWIKGEGFAEANAEYGFVTPCTMIVNWLEDWMTVSDLVAGTDWSTVFPDEEFTAETNTVLFEDWYNQGGYGLGCAPNGWTNCTVQFTPTIDTHNTYPYFRVYVGLCEKAYFDEIEINLIEE